MLKSLFIQNFVLIDNLDIRFDKGFSVITGETGAGKSIILGALSLVLGQRADGKSIKKGSDKCVIEAVFDVSKYQLEPFFLSNDLEYDADSCILRRELYASGKSRAFVNDSPVSLTILKELGSRLIDIHSQHQNLILASEEFRNASARIVLLHIPLGNGTWHGNIHLEELFLPILNDADIDVMLSGHTHRYSFHPANDKVRFPVLVNDNASLLKCDVGDGKITARIYGPEGTVTHSHEFPLK